MARILVIDDEPNVCWAFRKYLSGEGHAVLTASTAEAGLASARREKPDIVITDVLLPDGNGLDVLKAIRTEQPGTPVVIMTAQGTIGTAVEAVRSGAADYLAKPIDLARVRELVTRLLTAPAPQSPTSAPTESGDTLLVGRSAPMQEIFKAIARFADRDVTVLITGESGTGKELVAKALHDHSPRAGGPFVPVNCASIIESLIESELYGHERGAFTGAIARKTGKFEMAGGGTLFLDEVGDLPLSAQARLLRFLEERVLERVGGTERIPVDTRMIAATNQDLSARIAAGHFREDLFHRLNVATIRIPPLRERGGDIALLAGHFLQREGATPSLPPETLAALDRYPWPGNVRELKNAIQQAAALARGGAVLPEHLPPAVRTAAGGPGPSAASLDVLVAERLRAAGAGGPGTHERIIGEWEAPLIRNALEQTGFNQGKAARLLGVHRTTLRERMKKYGITE
ncbi:MAG: sigma-54 dependent transcriptional regulator [Planctomycetota bacterium]